MQFQSRCSQALSTLSVIRRPLPKPVVSAVSGDPESVQNPSSGVPTLATELLPEKRQCSLVPTKTAQDASKMPPRCLQDPPRLLQDPQRPSKMPPKASKSLQDALKVPPRRLKTFNLSSKNLQPDPPIPQHKTGKTGCSTFLRNPQNPFKLPPRPPTWR